MARYRVDVDEMLRYLGYAGQDLDATMRGRVEEMALLCEDISRPAFLHGTFGVMPENGGVRLAGTSLLLEGLDIAQHLDGALECAVMVCTLGLANEQRLKSLQASSPADALMFNAAGSALVESVAEACEAQVRAEAAERGLFANYRYSPGYGDLPVALQPQIVRVLGADKIMGVTANAASLLTPVKTVTAFVGLFDTPQSTSRKGCAGCPRFEYCEYREDGKPCYR